MGDGEGAGEGPDLSFVTTEEMVEELKKRSDGLVLMVVNDRDAAQSAANYWWRGRSCFECLGMAVTLAARLLSEECIPGEEPGGSDSPD